MAKEFKLLTTDPELVKMFNRFAFDQTLKASGLDQRTAAIACVAVNIGLNAEDNFKNTVYYAIKLGLEPIEIREIVYQSIPMVGFSRAVAFIEQMNEVFESEGIVLPLPNAATTNADDAYDKGLEFMKENFGPYIEKIGSLDDGDSTDFNHWLIEFGFGDFFTRGVLDAKTREMITFCVLYTQNANGKQTRTHVRVNFRMGNDKDFLVSVLKACTPFVGFPRTFNALNIVNAVWSEEQKFQDM